MGESYRAKNNYICFSIQQHMAQIKLGSLVTGIRGKIGGTIVQGGRTGYQMRNLVQPRKARTNTSSISRNYFAWLSRSWSVLAFEDRALWVAFATFQTRLNKFGDVYIPTGFQMFMEFNLFNHSIDGTVFLNVPPDPDAILPITNVDVIANGSTNDYRVTWDNPTAGNHQQVVMYAYPLCRMGAFSFHKSPALVALDVEIDELEIDFGKWWDDTYGEGNFQYMRFSIALRVIAPNAGYASSLYQASTIVL